jgi:hypothetical protein
MLDLIPDSLALTDSDGTVLEVPLRVSARARRLSLRVDPARGGAELVLPPKVDLGQAERFAKAHLGWLRTRLAKLPGRVAFADGAEIPVLGKPHVIRHVDRKRGGIKRVEIEPGRWELQVPGDVAFLARRLTDYLKIEAKRILTDRARHHAGALDRTPARITIRDTRSRWGSCSSNGNLSFSWRLILAPASVLDYVAAHEVAHLVEMNHSPRFWRLVERLVPDYKRQRAWLKRNGGTLHGYG